MHFGDYEETQRAIAIARQIINDTGYPPALDDERLGVDEFGWMFEDVYPGGLGDLRTDDPRDYAIRAVIAAVIYDLFPSADLTDERPESSNLFKVLREHLRHLSPADIPSVETLRWELHAAACARDLERLRAIARRLEELQPTADHLALIAQTFYIVVNLNTPFPFWLDPALNAPNVPNDVADLLIYHSTTQLSEDRDFTSKQLDILAVSESLLNRAELSGLPLTPTLTAIRCWCRHAIGSATGRTDLVLEAGRGFRMVPVHPLGSVEEKFDYRQWTLQAATRCFLQAGDVAEALESARLWSSVAPNNPAPFLALSEALYK